MDDIIKARKEYLNYVKLKKPVKKSVYFLKWCRLIISFGFQHGLDNKHLRALKKKIVLFLDTADIDTFGQHLYTCLRKIDHLMRRNRQKIIC